MSADNYIPSLTLEPNATAAVEEAPAPLAVKEDIPVEKPELSKLSPAEQAAVKEFAEKIDILNTEQVMNYGSAAQKNITEFSDAALSTVRTKDLGQVGDMLSDLVIELKGLNFDPEEKKGFLGFFKKSGNRIAELKAQYDKAMGILKENRAKLDELAKFLYERETITGDEFMAILNQ